jgi:hypothetical protein
MSGFSDKMIDDGFSDPQEYLDYLCDKALNGSNGFYYTINNEDECGDSGYYVGNYTDEE